MMQREKSSVCVAGVTEMWLSHFLDGIWVNHVAWRLFQNTIHQGCILEQTKERNQAGNMINSDLSEKWLLQACVCVTLQSVEGDKYKHNTGIKSYQNHRWRTISEAVDSVLQYTVQIIT